MSFAPPLVSGYKQLYLAVYLYDPESPLLRELQNPGSTPCLRYLDNLHDNDYHTFIYYKKAMTEAMTMVDESDFAEFSSLLKYITERS